jgi:hypothetical protein
VLYPPVKARRLSIDGANLASAIGKSFLFFCTKCRKFYKLADVALAALLHLRQQLCGLRRDGRLL